MDRPLPEQPAECRRENRRRFVLSLVPALSVLICLWLGQWLLAACLFWGTFFAIGYGAVLPRSRWFGPHVSELPPDQAGRGEVWITLDDGPCPATTPVLLEILDRHQVKAGFFLIGQRALAHPELVREIARRGHLIGNHSQTHPAASFWRLRPNRMWQEVAGCQETLRSLTGSTPVWFRPPVGHHNLFLFAPLRALGLTMAIWNCRGFDGVVKDPSAVLRRIAASLRPGSIVLLHDGPAASPEILERTLQLVAERGLRAALPDAIALGSPPPRRVS